MLSVNIDWRFCLRKGIEMKKAEKEKAPRKPSDFYASCLLFCALVALVYLVIGSGKYGPIPGVIGESQQTDEGMEESYPSQDSSASGRLSVYEGNWHPVISGSGRDFAYSNRYLRIRLVASGDKLEVIELFRSPRDGRLYGDSTYYFRYNEEEGCLSCVGEPRTILLMQDNGRLHFESWFGQAAEYVREDTPDYERCEKGVSQGGF